MTSPLALSPEAALTLERFGDEAQPLVCVEDALGDLAAVRAIAARHSYTPIGPFYPGIRAAVSERIAMPLVEPILTHLQQVFALERAPAFFECYLSIVTTPPGKLNPIQRLPHFDGTERERIAVLLYLSDHADAGTAFYRQKSTGFESVDDTRFDRYRHELEQATARHGIPPAAYIGTDSPLFMRTHAVAARANRMIAYHGNALHCASIGRDFVPDPHPATGRLTLNLFLR